MILYTLNKTPLKHLYFKKWGKKWVKNKIAPFLVYLNDNDTILDVGSGNGLVSWELQQLGYAVTPLDIENQAFSEEVKPIVYNGTTMPFKDKEFDVAIILSVLHHTENPEAILKEAGRVAKRIIINEDVYDSIPQKYLVYAADGFVNLGYSPCPRTNKTDAGWKETFKSLNFKLLNSKYIKVLVAFKQAIYHLETSKE